MSSRVDLIDQVRLMLAKAGFAVSERCNVRPVSFDVVARRDNRLFIIKVLGNVDAFSERVAQELRTLAHFLQGTPLLVGERSGAGSLEDGVAYCHRGIPVLTPQTMEELLLENTPPLAYATPGGLNVQLDGSRLRKIREERQLSLGDLAQVAGVSRRAVQMYEQGMRATVEAALRLEEYLGESLVSPVDPFKLFEPPSTTEPTAGPAPSRTLDPFEAEVFRMLRSVGLEIVPTRRSPFEALAHPPQEARESILTGVHHESDVHTRRRAQILASLSAVAERKGMIVVRREIRVTNIQGTPVIHQRELDKLRDPEELRRALEERRRGAKS